MTRFRIVEKNWLQYYSLVKSLPILSKAKELKLASRWRDKKDENALSVLVMSYARYAIKVAYDFRNYGLSISDLIQEANVGLMEAASRFDPKKGVRFSSYAIWWIKAAIQEYILRYSSMVRLGTTSSQKILFFKFRNIVSTLYAGQETSLTDEQRREIAQQLKVPVAAVKKMEMSVAQGDLHLNMKVSSHEGDTQWLDKMVDPHDTPETATMRAECHDKRGLTIARALEVLSDKERCIITSRFMEDQKKTLAEIGKAMGVTKERVRQIEKRALEKLRHHIMQASDHMNDIYDFMEA